jgi:hypothetical protein
MDFVSEIMLLESMQRQHFVIGIVLDQQNFYRFIVHGTSLMSV